MNLMLPTVDTISFSVLQQRDNAKMNLSFIPNRLLNFNVAESKI